MLTFGLIFDTIYPILTYEHGYSHLVTYICNVSPNKDIIIKENFWPILSNSINFSHVTQTIWIEMMWGHAPFRIFVFYNLKQFYLNSFGSFTTQLTSYYFSFQLFIKLSFLFNIMEMVSLCLMSLFLCLYKGKLLNLSNSIHTLVSNIVF